MELVAYTTANFGAFDTQRDPVEQTVPFDLYRFTEENCAPRSAGMTPRLQARLVKMFAWQIVPLHDYYLWVDSSCALLHPDSIRWFIDKCGDCDIAVLKHPNRDTVAQEADYLNHRLAINCPYITPRYKGEPIAEQMGAVDPGGPLYASTAFIYRLNDRTRAMFKEWWFHTTRYHLIDQLSFSHALSFAGCKVSVIAESYFKTPYITYVRA